MGFTSVWSVLILTTGNVIGAYIQVIDQEKDRAGLPGSNSVYFIYQLLYENCVYHGQHTVRINLVIQL